jgi:hypothetical protein
MTTAVNCRWIPVADPVLRQERHNVRDLVFGLPGGSGHDHVELIERPRRRYQRTAEVIASGGNLNLVNTEGATDGVGQRGALTSSPPITGRDRATMKGSSALSGWSAADVRRIHGGGSMEQATFQRHHASAGSSWRYGVASFVTG